MTSRAERRKAILQKRAEHLRQLADTCPGTEFASEIGALAQLLADTAARVVVAPEPNASRTILWRSDEGLLNELLDHLRRKSDGFLRRSRETLDPRQSEELRRLSAMFGAEIVRLRNSDLP